MAEAHCYWAAALKARRQSTLRSLCRAVYTAGTGAHAYLEVLDLRLQLAALVGGDGGGDDLQEWRRALDRLARRFSAGRPLPARPMLTGRETPQARPSAALLGTKT
jgi:hypothetical protein